MPQLPVMTTDLFLRTQAGALATWLLAAAHDSCNAHGHGRLQACCARSSCASSSFWRWQGSCQTLSDESGCCWRRANERRPRRLGDTITAVPKGLFRAGSTPLERVWTEQAIATAVTPPLTRASDTPSASSSFGGHEDTSEHGCISGLRCAGYHR